MDFGTMPEYIAYWAEQVPDKVALIDADTDRKCTYGDFWRYVCAFAKRLADVGARRDFDEYGSRIVVRVAGFIETMVAQYAIYLVGGIYCPVEKNMKEPKMLEMLEYYDAEIYVSTEDVGVGTFIDITTSTEENATFTGDVIFPEPEALCAIVFTTGTTGKAKGVMRNHKSIVFPAVNFRDYFKLCSSSIYAWLQPLDRIGCMAHNSRVFVVGAALVHYGKGVVFAKKNLSVISTYKIDCLFLQPFAVNILLTAGEKIFCESLKNVRYLVLGGAAVPSSMVDLLTKKLPKTEIFIDYGMTEVTFVTVCHVNKDGYAPNYVGKPARGNSVRIIQKTDEDLGAVWISSDGLMTGYWKAKELTKNVLIDGGLLTADMGKTDGKNDLFLLGRKDDVIVSGGFKLAPYEIEDAAKSYEGIEECVCLGKPHNELQYVPVLLVKMKENFEFNAKDILDFLVQKLETYKRPRNIIELEEFPLTPNSTKIDRNELKKYV